MASTCVQYVYHYEVSVFNRSKDIEGIPKSPYLYANFAMRMRRIT